MQGGEAMKETKIYNIDMCPTNGEIINKTIKSTHELPITNLLMIVSDNKFKIGF